MEKVINNDLLDGLLKQAAASPRRRSHLNFHDGPESAVQRLCIGLVDGTYVRPHRHPQANKWEVMLVLRGRVRVVLFDPEGAVSRVFEFADSDGSKGMEIPANVCHTVLPLTAEAAILEFKEGPYDSQNPAVFADWAPMEGSPDAGDFLAWVRDAAPGDRFSPR